MTRLQDGLIWRFKEATDPNSGMPHQLGRVIRVNRKLHTVDVALRYGGTLTNVRVLKDVAGTNEGSGWLPDVDSGKTEDATPTFPGTGTNDSYCVVGYIEGRQREPYVVGFVPPPQFETSFEKMNVTKFHNGMYMVVDDDGWEIHRPDGTFFRIGATNTSTDLTALNASKDVPFDPGSGSAKPAASVAMGNGAGAKTELKADGGIQMTTPSNVQVTDSTGTFTLGAPGGVPVDVTKAAASAGAGATPSRSDHKHDISTAAPSDVTKAAAAEGTATSIARSDHKHDASTAAPANVTKAAAAEGTATSLSRSDHKHDATTAAPSDVTKAAAAEGSASSLSRSDHKHDASTAAAGASAFSDSAAEGTATSLSRSDHRHSREATPVTFATPAITLGSAAAAGAAGTVVRSDSGIAAFDATAPSTQSYGDAASVGVINFAARRDHKHGMPPGTKTTLFTASGTWTKATSPAPKLIEVICISAGGGAEAGATSASGPSGGAGGGGAYVRRVFDPSATGATESVTVGVGGTGGAASLGNGTAGGASTFGSLVTATGGGFGGVGTDSTGGAGGDNGTGTSASGSNAISGQGGSSSATGNAEWGGAGGANGVSAGTNGLVGKSSLYGAGSGGSGGGSAGGAGAVGGAHGSYATGGGGAAGTNPGGAGGAGTSRGGTGRCGDGGGGGGANGAGTGGAGGAGGVPGGGGGSGGAGSSAGGAGGAGGRGEVFVIEYF